VAATKHAVLIADDHESDRFFLKRVIADHAPHLEVVGEVTNGEQVIAYLEGSGAYADRKKHPLPELLILDMRMPRMTGMEVLEWLRGREFPHLRIAMMADSSGSIHRERTLDLGAHHFYSKLLGTGQLIEMVKALEADLESVENPTPRRMSSLDPTASVPITAAVSPKRILIVEDKPVVADSIRRLLSLDGHGVVVEEDGVSALARFEPGAFDLIITDFEMPGMDGLELAAAVKRQCPTQPIMLISAYIELIKNDERLSLVDLAIGKMFSLGELRAALAGLFPPPGSARKPL
jgi:CheY-like chemotaxis protein